MQPSLSQSNWAASQAYQEFVPQTEYPTQILQQTDPNTAAANIMGYADPFAIATGVQGIANNHAAATLNPYAQDATTLSGTSYYQSASTFAQPVSKSGVTTYSCVNDYR
jgi:hypothetical protein